MTSNKLEIHSENILPIIKRWLYSEKDIFVRELVSNACDAIHKLKILRDRGEADVKDEEFEISISIDKANGTLTFSDTGIGMTADEVKKYIAQIAFSGAESFMEKYQSSSEKEQFIGHFGLGFYSAYMVGEKVEIQTLSHKADAQPAFWSCDGSAEYTLEPGSRKSRGTDIIIHVNDESSDFLEDATLRKILQRYCSFLPYPISLNGTRINDKEPLWIKSAADCSEQEYLEFYRRLHPMQPDPLFWVHLNVDYPFNLQGILYFPKLQKNMDLNKSAVQLYCNRVFVSDNCKEIIPDYLMPMQGIIDSPDIPLNVSRSYLQMDKTVRQLSSHIAKKVADSLSALYKTDREKFIACWEDLSLVVKLGAVQDEKFYQRVKEFLVWNTFADDWITTEEYLERNKERSKDKIFYAEGTNYNSTFLQMFKDQGIDVIHTGGPLDQYVVQTLEKQLAPAKFQRIDAAVEDHLLDASREKNFLDAEGKTEAGKLAEFIRGKLKDTHVEVEAKSLQSNAVPGFIMIDENQRRLKDYMLSLDPEGKSGYEDKRTFIVNTNSPLVAALPKLEKKDPELSQDVVHMIYELALVSQKEMKPEMFQQFLQRTSSIMEKLTDRVVGD